MNYILIIILLSGVSGMNNGVGGGPAMATFNSLSACKEAGVRFQQFDVCHRNNVSCQYTCVPEGEGY